MNTLIQLATAASSSGAANTVQHAVKYGEAINKGQAVYVSSSDGTNMIVSKADYSSELTSSKTIGLVISTGPLNYQGTVITEGLLAGTGSEPLNTISANAGDPAWLGDDGNLIFGYTNKPKAPNHLVFIGIVTRVHAVNGEIFVKVQNGYELDELHDVLLKGTGNVPTDGTVLTYEALTGLWKAKPIVNNTEAPLAFVMAATEGPLTGVQTYYNGPANDGIGATLTSTTNVVLSDGTAVGRIDTNYIPDLGDLILVKNQTNQVHNGVYEITQIGSGSQPYILTRSVDVDQPVELYPLQVNAFQGLVNGSKYFTQTNSLWGNTVPPVIGGSAPNSNIAFDLTSLTTSPLQITFVDNVSTSALPTCVYALGTDLTKPGVGATLTASVAGLLTVAGMSASSTTAATNTFATILVSGQAEPRHNGTYQVINPGSATAKWVLQRIDNLAAGFNKAFRIVFCSHNVSGFAGNYFIPTWNPTLLNKNIGVTSGITLATNRIDYVKYGFGAGKVGIKNSSGVYTYYSSLSSAMTAAVSGQTVDLLTDITETGSVTITTKAGVKINGNGYTYTLSVNDGTHAITNGVTNLVELFNIKVVRTGRANNATGVVYYKLDTTNLCTLKCQNVVFENTYGIAVAANTTILNGLTINSYGDGASVPFDSMGLINCSITSSNGYGINLGYSSYDIVNCNVTGSTFGINGGYGTVYNSIGRSTTGTGISATRVVDSTGTSSSSIGISATNGYNCVGISISGVGLSGNFTNSTAISTSGIASSGGTKINCTLRSVSNYASSLQDLFNCYILSESNIAIMAVSGNVINSCSIRSLWNNAGGHAFNTSAASAAIEITNSYFTVSNTSAYCINSPAGSTIKYSGNKYKGSTIPVNTTNITQGLTNTQDNQGNILL